MDENLPGYENFKHWTIEIRGKPGLDISMDLVEPDDDTVNTKAVQYGVAGAVINAIPEVCAAPPGVFEAPVFAPFRNPGP